MNSLTFSMSEETEEPAHDILYPPKPTVCSCDFCCGYDTDDSVSSIAESAKKYNNKHSTSNNGKEDYDSDSEDYCNCDCDDCIRKCHGHCEKNCKLKNVVLRYGWQHPECSNVAA